MFDLRSQHVLLTGATGGLGGAMAESMASRGARLLLTGRDERRLDKLAAQLRDRGTDAEYIPADLADADSLKSLCDELPRIDPPIDVLINNAAIGLSALAEDHTMEHLRRLFAVNVFSAVEITNALLPAMKQRRHGFIVNIGSVVGLRAMPAGAGYGMTKHALRAHSDVLRVELRGTGVRVLHVCPGLLDSPFVSRSEKLFDRPPGGRATPIEVAAEKTVRAIERQRRQIVFPWSARAAVLLDRLAPRLLDWILFRMFLQGKEPPEGETG